MAKKKSNKWLYILGGIVVVLIIVSLIFSSKKPKGETIEVEQVATRTIKETVVASGKIYPETEVKISSDVSGEIVELYVLEGDSVKAGQLVAKINPDTYVSSVERGVASLNSAKSQKSIAQAQILSSIAQKEQIEAQIANARNIYNRNKQLKADGVISAADFEASESSLRALEANARSSEASVASSKANVQAAEFSIKSAEASLQELRTSLQRTSIYAPTNGIVSLLNVEKGERVVGTMQMTGTEMMRIANLNSMEVQVDVSENDIVRVSLNDEVEIEVDAYIGRKFKGNVYQIANSASSLGGAAQATSTDQVTNFSVKIRIDPASYSDLITPTKPFPFRPGMSASVAIQTNVKPNVISVPIQSVTVRDPDKTDEAPDSEEVVAEPEESENKNNGEKKPEAEKEKIEVVFVMEADTVRLVPVKTGIQDDTYIEILEGLKGDEKVVSGPYSAISRQLKNGSKVVLKEKKKED
jgi:HlyD family secretion protein